MEKALAKGWAQMHILGWDDLPSGHHYATLWSQSDQVEPLHRRIWQLHQSRQTLRHCPRDSPRKRSGKTTQKWSDLPNMMQHGQDWHGSGQQEMERNLERYRISDATGKFFPPSTGQALRVYRRIVRYETLRTKVATEASCEYVQFCLFLLSCTFSLHKRNSRSWKIARTLPFTTFFPCVLICLLLRNVLLKTSVWKWGNWLFLCHSFTWAFVHCNDLTATAHL